MDISKSWGSCERDAESCRNFFSFPRASIPITTQKPYLILQCCCWYWLWDHVTCKAALHDSHCSWPTHDHEGLWKPSVHFNGVHTTPCIIPFVHFVVLFEVLLFGENLRIAQFLMFWNLFNNYLGQVTWFFWNLSNMNCFVITYQCPQHRASDK